MSYKERQLITIHLDIPEEYLKEIYVNVKKEHPKWSHETIIKRLTTTMITDYTSEDNCMENLTPELSDIMYTLNQNDVNASEELDKNICEIFKEWLSTLSKKELQELDEYIEEYVIDEDDDYYEQSL